MTRTGRAALPAWADATRADVLGRIVDQVGDGVAVVDNDGHFLLANPAFAAMHGCPGEDLVGQLFTIFYPPAEHAGPVQALIADALRDGVGRAEVVRSRRDGSTFPAHVTLSLLRGEEGELIGRVLSVQDITERKRLEAELRRQALHDPLTGLPNRRLLLDRLEQALVRAERVAGLVAVLFVDLDGFKQVNDAHGHAAGDELLVAAARRLSACLRPSDTLARLGGDEFVAVLDDLPDPARALHTAERLRAALAAPREPAAGSGAASGDAGTRDPGLGAAVTASVGVALARGGAPHQLLEAADRAMYGAKARGKDRVGLGDDPLAAGRTGARHAGLGDDPLAAERPGARHAGLGDDALIPERP